MKRIAIAFLTTSFVLFSGYAIASKSHVIARSKDGTVTITQRDLDIYYAFDKYQNDNPDIPDDVVTQRFARRVGLTPTKLSDTYTKVVLFLGDPKSYVQISTPKTSRHKAVEDKKTIGDSCYNLGFRYGKCAITTMDGGHCPESDNFAIPDRCLNSKATQAGIRAGGHAARR